MVNITGVTDIFNITGVTDNITGVTDMVNITGVTDIFSEDPDWQLAFWILAGIVCLGIISKILSILCKCL
jgi:hypothetical protein